MNSKIKFSLFISILVLEFSIFTISAINYTISFTGSGASSTVDEVLVQNLTQGTKVTLPINSLLNLVTTLTSSIEQIKGNSNINIKQQSGTGIITVSFYAQNEGITQVNIVSVDGRKIANINQIISQGINNFDISLPKGLFVLQIHGLKFKYIEKIINSSESKSKPSITFVSSNFQHNSIPLKSKTETESITQMVYNAGDCLLYNAKSGNYSTIVTDVPTANKTINFDFVSCQDADLNNYTSVTIGTQTWMAENLKTTKYQNGDIIGTTSPATKVISPEATPKYQWAYNGDETKVPKYGRLYTWYTVTDSRSIAPTGWHVATDAEWTTLTKYVSANLGTCISVTKALAATIDWAANATTSELGNNYSGFSALSGGAHYGYGPFSNVGYNGYWWSNTEDIPNYAWYRYLYFGDVNLSRLSFNKSAGYSVRCVRNSQ